MPKLHLNQPERYTAVMVADSVHAFDEKVRMSTMLVALPRPALADYTRHRAFTYSVRSTRAVPTKTLIAEIRENPYLPVIWGSNKKGMSEGPELPAETREYLERRWRRAAATAAYDAEDMMNQGLHKQWSGRVLEPYMWTAALVSATEFANYMRLRDDAAAMPELQMIAQAMRRCLDGSTPKVLRPGQWHLPFADDAETRGIVEEHIDRGVNRYAAFERRDHLITETLKKVSAARCARTSYKPFDGNGSVVAEIMRFDGLVGAQPVHASPVEHIATPDNFGGGFAGQPYANRDNPKGWHNVKRHRNLVGFNQYRSFIPFDTVYEMPPEQIAFGTVGGEEMDEVLTPGDALERVA